MKGKSLRASVNAFCRSCVFDAREPGGWREQVGACTATGCPLHLVRPRPRAREVVQATKSGPFQTQDTRSTMTPAKAAHGARIAAGGG